MVSRVSSAFGARTTVWLEIQRDPYKYIDIAPSQTAIPSHTCRKPASEKNGIICNDDTRAGISRNKLCAQQHAAFKYIFLKTQ